ncbi:sensor histidine kinase [Chitinophaga defluvii]|uniref:histidine kinase n=1 Tax=Chitinophaga defluvii TaxID=3163343 RepID=A0ABV2T6D5_9BACT
MRYKLSIPITAFLIVITILVITAFQAYWLNNNYRDEKRLFTARTNVLFRETIFRLQASKLKLDTNINIRMQDRGGVIGISNVLRDDIQDSLPERPRSKHTVLFARTVPTAARIDTFNVQYNTATARGPVDTRVVEFLADVDSLRASISVQEIADRYAKTLAREGIMVSFRIDTIPMDTAQYATTYFPEELESNMVTIGFTNPVRYQVLFNNNTWYLLQRISQPILISFLLLGVTVLSFLLLYRNLKQQQKLAQLKNDFINNMTHELKTPIATVSVAIEALRNFDALEDRQLTNEYLDISANEMQRLGQLVDKVLKLSMFENKEIALNKEEFDIAALARSVITSMKLQFDKQHAVTALKMTGTNFVITADKLHMTSVLYNLLDNALKYTPKEPDILIHIIDHKRFLEIRITDNGIGIAREYERKIFEKFFRVPSGNRHNTKGYGLGLSYVSHIVQRHMGFITVESELGKGSTFSIKLPFAEAPVIYYDKGRRIVKLKIG